MKSLISIIMVYYSFFILISCSEKEKSTIPTVKTNEILEITGKFVTVSGSIISDGGIEITIKGICWSTSKTGDFNYYSNDGKGIGDFTHTIDALVLLQDTTYFIKAYATNKVGTGFGEILSFKTLPKAHITTSSVINITFSSAVAGGNVTYDGNLSIFERGVCWSINEYPTIMSSKTIDGTGLGEFTSIINGLKSNTTYYIRSYAKNERETVYGSQISFKTPYEIEKLKDTCGNIYNAVRIGNQMWMAENLRTTKYNDNSLIPYVSINSWDTTSTSDNYRWYANDEKYKSYGAFYNWYTVNTGKLCPIGWHVPSNSDWTILANYIGVNASYKLKKVGVNAASLSSVPTNESGFSAIFPGYYYLGGHLVFGYYTYWWSSTEFSSTYAYSRGVGWWDDKIGYFGLYKVSGLSIRCVKD